MKNIEVLIYDFQQAEKNRGPIPMLPVVEMYQTVDYKCFQSQYRDYLWFNEKQKEATEK